MTSKKTMAMRIAAREENNGLGSTVNSDLSLYFSPRDLAERWRCSRTSAQRIADRVGFSKVLLGEGKHGIVRYVRSEVEEYEASRTVSAVD